MSSQLGSECARCGLNIVLAKACGPRPKISFSGGWRRSGGGVRTSRRWRSRRSAAGVRTNRGGYGMRTIGERGSERGAMTRVHNLMYHLMYRCPRCADTLMYHDTSA